MPFSPLRLKSSLLKTRDFMVKNLLSITISDTSTLTEHLLTESLTILFYTVFLYSILYSIYTVYYSLLNIGGFFLFFIITVDGNKSPVLIGSLKY